MNFSRADSRSRPGARLQLTSMIDVIFLLLLFFMVTSAQQSPESRLASGLAVERREASASADFQPQVIDVGVFDGAPGFRLGERILRDQAELAAAVSRLPKETGVFVRVAPDVRVDWPARALQACQDAGFTRVNYVPAR